MRRDSGSLIFAGLFFLISAIVLLYFYFSRDQITSKNDIKLVHGPYEKYDWIDKGGKNGSSLTFHLLGYNATFKIKADFFSVLKKDDFKAIPQRKNLIIGIPNKDTLNLKSHGEIIFVYSIAGDDFTYMSFADTLKKHTTNLLLIAAGFFGIFGALLIYFGRRAKVRHQIL